MNRLDEQDVCALCGLLLSRSITPTLITVGREGERAFVCEDSSACRRRAIEIVRAYEKMKL